MRVSACRRRYAPLTIRNSGKSSISGKRHSAANVPAFLSLFQGCAARKKTPRRSGAIKGGIGGHAAPQHGFQPKPQRIRSSGLFPGRVAGVFLVYDGVHPLAGLLEQLFAKFRAVHLFCQPHTIPSVVLKVLCCTGRHGFAPSKFHSSDSIMRFIALSSIVDTGGLCKCRRGARTAWRPWKRPRRTFRRVGMPGRRRAKLEGSPEPLIRVSALLDGRIAASRQKLLQCQIVKNLARGHCRDRQGRRCPSARR